MVNSDGDLLCDARLLATRSMPDSHWRLAFAVASVVGKKLPRNYLNFEKPVFWLLT